jgi:hypothetical protein
MLRRRTVLKRIVRASFLAATLTALTAGATLAHECYVVNRSAHGNAAAGTHSKAWIYVELPDLAAFMSDPSSEDALPQLSPSQLEYFVARAQELGVPSNIGLFVGGRPHTGGFTIAGAADGFVKNGKGADGSGMEHFFAAHFENVVTAYMEALAEPVGE